METLNICVYCDSTDLYSEEEIMFENLTDISFPKRIVEDYFEECVDGYDSFEKFLNNYTADDTECLFFYAVRHGYYPKR